MKTRGVYEKEPGSEVWWIRYADATGKIRREKAGSKSDALDLVRKRKSDILRGKKLPEKLRAKDVRFSEIAAGALEYSKAHKLSYQHDCYRMRGLVEEFGPQSAESLRPQDFDRWLAAHDWSRATKNRYVALLKLTYRVAEDNGKIATNPTRKLRMPQENNAVIRYLDQFEPLPAKVAYLKKHKSESKRLHAVIEKDYYFHLPEYLIALHTGMRRSEQYGLTWRNVDLKKRMLTIPRSKSGSLRYVRLNTVALRAFKALARRRSGGETVFVTMKDGGQRPLTTNRHWFEDAVSKAGLRDFTWHDLRHTFASFLAMRGTGLRTIQQLMGHQTIAMTCRYAHLSPEHELEAVEKLV